MKNVLLVGLGGMIGSMLRYIISLINYKHIFPLITLIINTGGAILIGCVAGIASKRNISADIILFLKTGICGGFSTFSAFSLEAYLLYQNGNYICAALYVLLSFLGCFLGVWFGIKLF